MRHLEIILLRKLNPLLKKDQNEMLIQLSKLFLKSFL